MKTSIFVFIAIVLLIATGCMAETYEPELFMVAEEREKSIEKDGENEMADESVATTEHEFVQSADEWWEDYVAEHKRTHVDYIIHGDYAPADRNIDLHRIERFVFFSGTNVGGYGFVLDKIHGRLYYSPDFPNVESLESIDIFAKFKEDDLDRLIIVIEESGMLGWEKSYPGEDDGTTASSGWAVGILFDDGTIFRSTGGGWVNPGRPPEDQFRILTDFVQTIGEEIISRHNAEQATE